MHLSCVCYVYVYAYVCDVYVHAYLYVCVDVEVDALFECILAYVFVLTVFTQERHVAHNLRGRLSALGLTCVNDTMAPPNSEPSVILMDEGTVLDPKLLQQGVPCISVGWSRPPTFVGEFLRKPIRSKQLIDALRRSFKAPPIGTHMCVVWLYCCGCNVWL